jgi:hypothetical protein
MRGPPGSIAAPEGFVLKRIFAALEELQTTGRVFGDDIEADPWVLYHGTSNVAEDGLLSNGLAWKAGPYTKEDVRRVCAIYNRLGWAGFKSSGFPVLQPFSLDHDFGGNAAKPLFLAPTAYRATCFATRDFAGGETVRALHYALEELHALLADGEAQRLYLDSLSSKSSGPNPNDAVRLLQEGWLEQELSATTALRERVRHVRAVYSYGLVVAVKLHSASLQGLCFHQTMGVRAMRLVGADEVVAVAVIPPMYEHNPLARTDSPFDWPTWSGILAAIPRC